MTIVFFAGGYISGIGTLIDLFFSVIIAIRLYKPAKEDNFRIDSFRGSFFLTFVFFSIFFFFMSFSLIQDDLMTVGLWGYTFGHIFLYLALAVNIFTPFSILDTSKKIPYILSSIILIAASYITYVNWVAYATKETLPKYESGAAVWNPPEIVAIFIAASAVFVWFFFGTLIFWYHAKKTQVAWLRRRSIFIGLGLLLVTLGGPLHDIKVSGFLILLADIVTSTGFVVISFGIFAKPETDT